MQITCVCSLNNNHHCQTTYEESVATEKRSIQSSAQSCNDSLPKGHKLNTFYQKKGLDASLIRTTSLCTANPCIWVYCIRHCHWERWDWKSCREWILQEASGERKWLRLSVPFLTLSHNPEHDVWPHNSTETMMDGHHTTSEMENLESQGSLSEE